eukprot:1730666-Pyramimonas_sp.AAC.1
MAPPTRVERGSRMTLTDAVAKMEAELAVRRAERTAEAIRVEPTLPHTSRIDTAQLTLEWHRAPLEVTLVDGESATQPDKLDGAGNEDRCH